MREERGDSAQVSGCRCLSAVDIELDRTMKQVALRRIEIDATGRLLLAPAVSGSTYAYIYREAKGIRWDPRESSFVAYEPAGWQHAELAAHIVQTVREALSVRLVVTERTTWSNVSPATEGEIREMLGASAV